MTKNMAKKTIVVLFGILLACGVACAQEEAQEEEGLIPRLMKRLKKAEEAKPAAQATAPAAEKAADVPVPSVAATEAPLSGAVISGGTAYAAPSRMSRVKGMSREDLIKEINMELDDEEDVLDYMPELKKLKDESGNDYYGYNDGTKMVRLESLQKPKLESLLSKIYNKVTIIQTQRINQQLETIRQVQNIQRQVNSIPRVPPSVPVIPQQPPRPPAVATPQAPSAQTPPAPPRIPPAAPRR